MTARTLPDDSQSGGWETPKATSKGLKLYLKYRRCGRGCVWKVPKTGILNLNSRSQASGEERFTAAIRFFWQFVQAFYLITDANQKHRLFGIFQQVDNALLLVLQIDRLAIRQQM